MGDRQDFVTAAKYGILLSEQPSPGGPHMNDARPLLWASRGIRDIIDLGVIIAGGSDGIMALVNWRKKWFRQRSPANHLPAATLFARNWQLAWRTACGCTPSMRPIRKGKEAVRGSIEVGKVADFQVLDRDIFAVAHEEIGASRVVHDHGWRKRRLSRPTALTRLRPGGQRAASAEGACPPEHHASATGAN